MADDIAQWPEGLGLGQYAEAFVENDIEFKNLPRLTEADLKGIGSALDLWKPAIQIGSPTQSDSCSSRIGNGVILNGDEP